MLLIFKCSTILIEIIRSDILLDTEKYEFESDETAVAANNVDCVLAGEAGVDDDGRFV